MTGRDEPRLLSPLTPVPFPRGRLAMDKLAPSPSSVPNHSSLASLLRAATAAATRSTSHPARATTVVSTGTSEAAVPTLPEGNQQPAPFLSLRAKVEYWKGIGATDFTVGVIEGGYRLNFNCLPESISIQTADNRVSARVEEKFVRDEIVRLVANGAIERCDRPCVISPLSVVRGKKLRLIHDLSSLNVFLHKTRFRLEDLSSAWYSLPLNGYLATFDLRSGYHHLSIAREDRPYLAFSWEGVTYQFAAMPFGLSPAPWVFTKVFRSLVRMWREKGYNVTLYLDDGLILAQTEEELVRVVRAVREDLERAGVSIAEEKSNWIPSQLGSWLGFEIDLREGSVRVSEDRVVKALERLTLLREEEFPTVRDRNRVTGSLMSMSLVLGDSATLLTRALLCSIAKAQQSSSSPNTRLPLSGEEKGEIDQWICELKQRSVRSFVDPPWHFDLRVETDASANALGVVVREREGEEPVARTSRNLSPSEREESSTLRELRAVEFAVTTFEREWKGLNVLFFGDNQSTMSILKKGSMKEELHEIAMRVERARVRMGARFKFHWIPREMNTEADMASRDIDADDWSLQGWVVERAVNKWGRPDIDMFADNVNTKCERFVSRVPNRGSYSIDAFARPDLWSSQSLLWCVPPPSLLCQTLAWMKGAKARGILGLPYWTSHPVFPSLFPPDNTPTFIRDYIMLEENSNILIPGSYGQGPFSRPFMDSPFCLLFLDFNST